MQKTFQPFRVPAIINPHCHFREDPPGKPGLVANLIRLAMEGGAAVFGPMPNLEKGLLTTKRVLWYRDFCNIAARPLYHNPRFIFYLQITESTTMQEIDDCVDAGILDAKVYPFARTTSSHLGVKNYANIMHLVEHAGRKGMRVHFHPEHPDLDIENRDAEYLFIPIIDMLLMSTEATIVWEHGTDARCIPFWKKWAKTGRFFVTITAHHLVTSESKTYGDVQATCKPSYKTERDREGLWGLVAEDHDWVMLGADDAPHDKKAKHVLGPCACGAYTAPFLMALCAHALRDLLVTERGQRIFQRFINGNAAQIYNIDSLQFPSVYIEDRPMRIPTTYEAGPWTIEPFWAGRELSASYSYVKNVGGIGG